MELTADQIIALQVRIQRGRAIREFLGSAVYTAHIQGYIAQRKEELIAKAYLNLESHSILAAAIGAHFELGLFEDSLKTTAADAHLNAEDLPEDQSPDLTQ